MGELSVDEMIRLVDGLKERGVLAFRGAGLDIQLGNAPKKRDVKAKKIVPDKEPRKNAVDLALDLSGKAGEDE